ncbi:MAG: hypothetical protein IPM51_12455 [Sphingobacteriaceae bacterium]|nr:hypothetical protein [Sphingobacteriaceae bacterium]
MELIVGGFILSKKNWNYNYVKRSINIFERKNLAPNKEIDFLDFKLIIYKKRSVNNENFFQFSNSDFIASTGTPVYKNRIGEEAAKNLYQDILTSKNIDFSNLRGHYCYLIKINDKFLIFNDYNGLYHVYHDIDKNVFSNSFLAISEILSHKEVSAPELYEYILYESTFGRKTIVKNINQLNNRYIHEICPGKKEIEKYYTIDDEPNYLKFDETVKYTSEKITNYFKCLLDNFQSMTLGLSGGFDSRLILMCLLNNNRKPKIYTSGSKDSFDVNFARNICKTFNLDFTHYDLKEEHKYSVDRYKELIVEKFINTDGIVYNGIFSSFGTGMDIDSSEKAELNFNGAGGEIYQSFWKLPGNSLNISEFIQSRYNNFNSDLTTNIFNKTEFFRTLGKKNLESLDFKPKNSKISGDLIELLYPNFRLRYWFGKITSRLNQFCYSLVPFSEPYFYFYSYKIPIKFKVGGKFEAALLKNINPEIAKYNSQYGFNFFEGPPLKHQILDWFKIYTPIYIRPLFRRVKSKNLSGLQELKENSKIFFNDPLLIDEFINRDKVTNIEMYSRILTVEYFLRNFM